MTMYYNGDKKALVVTLEDIVDFNISIKELESLGWFQDPFNHDMVYPIAALIKDKALLAEFKENKKLRKLTTAKIGGYISHNIKVKNLYTELEFARRESPILHIQIIKIHIKYYILKLKQLLTSCCTSYLP